MSVALLMIVGIILAALELGLGTAIGFWLRGRRESPVVVPDNRERNELALLQDVRARNAIENLQQLTASVAAQVGEHNSQVQTINSELSSAQAAGGEGLDATVFASLTKLLQANEALNEQLKSAETRLSEQKRELAAREADALTDTLTGRANRRAFDNELERRLGEYTRRQTPATLLMIDVDFFKKFNDTHGHQAGDEVLRGVGQTLYRSCRDMDLVCRYGGEEFGVIMPATTLAQSRFAVDRCRAAIEKALYEFEGKELKVTISQGVAETIPGDTPAALIKRADEALYAAKKNGRNRAYVHTSEKVEPLEDQPQLDAPKPVVETAENLQEDAASKQEPAPQTSGETDIESGVNIRAVYNLDVRRRVAESKRCGSPLSTMVVMVDDLKNILAKHGVATASSVVRTVAQFLAAAIREMDTVARFSDDSFAVLLPGTQLANATSIAERLRHSISMKPLPSPSGDVDLTVSIGVATIEGEDDAERFTQRCVSAANAAQQAGFNRTQIHRDGRCFAVDVALAG